MDAGDNPFEKKKRGKKPLPEEKKFRTENKDRGNYGKDKDIEYVTLSGLALTKDGEVTTRNYFSFLRDYVNPNNDLLLKKEDALKLQKYMIGLSTGTSAMAPLLCAGERCPYSDTCPFMDEKNDLDPPLGRKCPIENEIMINKKIAYIKEYDVEMSSVTDMALVDELVRLDIMEMRVTAQLAKERDNTTVSDEVIGADSEGNIITSRQVSPYLASLEKISNMKYRVLRRMVADRESKWKRAAALKQKEGNTTADNWASLREQVEHIRQAVDQKMSEMARPIVVDVDKKEDGGNE